jgi:DNA-directed RNA polymerase specialized sigma subunit
MTALQTVFSAIFYQGAEIRLTLDEEAAAINGARGGDEQSLVSLMYAYAPALRRAVRKYRDILGADDAHSLAIEGLLSAVHAYDSAKSNRLASLVAETIARHLSDAAMASESAWSIPERTLQRWYSIVRSVGGDVSAALTVAQEKGMSREVFLDILTTLRQTNSLDDEIHGAVEGEHSRDLDARPLWGDADAFAAAEDRLMADIALGAVEGLEESVTRFAYGFETGEAMSDNAIVHEMSERELGQDAALAGQTVVSRATVQRARASALGTMRTALGI